MFLVVVAQVRHFVDLNTGTFILWERFSLTVKSTEDKKGSELFSLSVRWRTSLNHNEHGKAKKSKKTMSLMGTRVDAIRSQSHTKRREKSPTWNRRCIFFFCWLFFFDPSSAWNAIV